MNERQPQPRPVTCLLVDDKEENLIALGALLRRPDVRLLEARSGAQALELLLTHEVALALLDVQMPEMDGFELAELMRGSARTRDIPIIFVTAGRHDQFPLFKGYEAGAVDFLYKPIDPHILRSKADVFFQLFRQREQLLRELDEKTETLRMNEMFAAVLGHDLRAPLSAVITGATLIDRRSGDEEIKRVAKRIVDSSTRMGRMIEDLLDVARARVGNGIGINRAPMNLGGLVQRVAQEQRVVFPERDINITSEGELSGEWDQERLGQVFSNLIGNAMQHGRGSEPVCIRLDGRDPAMAVVTVGNRGAIAPDAIPYLFDPFRSGQRTANRTGGLGLGLFITRQIVQAHGGDVSVDTSEIDRTIFRVTVPRASDTQK